MLPFISVVFTSSLGLSIIQTYRQPMLLILSTLPISSVLLNSTLSHCVIPALSRQALDIPSSKSPNLRQHTTALAVACYPAWALPIFITITQAATP
jgi:hypothetical protein